ncbi:MAG: hypothetical protein ACK4MF_02875 [Hyphomicrobiaceae bacterium]
MTTMSHTMTLTNRPVTVRSARSSVGQLLYVVGWLLLGLAAAAYLAALTAQPDFAPDWLTRRPVTVPQDNQGQRATADAGSAHAAALRKELASREAEIKRLQLRLAGLEQDLADARQKIEAAALANASGSAPATTGGIEMVNASAIGIDGSPLAGGAATPQPPLPERRPQPPALRQSVGVPAGGGGPGGIVTGSVAAPVVAGSTDPATEPAASPVNFAAAVVTRENAPQSVGVRLTTGPSIDALRLSWSLLIERHGATLANLEPRYVAGGSSLAPYSLIAGPIASDAAARKLCDDLRAKGIPCTVGTFTGNAL